MAVSAVPATSAAAPAAPRSRRAAGSWNLAAYLLGLVVIVGAVNVLAQHPPLRGRMDATKTRAYSLSEQTQRLLERLEGRWRIAMVMSGGDAAATRAVRRQIDEVLARFAEAAPALEISRIDPADPRSLREFERLLAELRSVYADRIERYEQALDAAGATFAELQAFARREAPALQQAAAALPAESAARQPLAEQARMLALIAAEGDALREAFESVRRTDGGRPLPDWEAARSIMAEALGRPAAELHEAARVLEQVKNDPAVAAPVRRYAAGAAFDFSDFAGTLVAAADPLRHLPPMELSEIGQHLQEGETAVVVGPRGAAVIPSSQLLPRSDLRAGGGGVVSFDQRFRGEQQIAAAIRSLEVGELPMVVFVHGEEHSLLRGRSGEVDLVGMSAMLKLSRFDVREWIVHREQRPVPEPGQGAVWVIVPPPQRASLEVGAGEQRLLETAAALLREGEPVLLSIYPSMLPQFRRPDPWAGVLQPLGLEARTGVVVYQASRRSEEELTIERGQVLRQYAADHAIGRALQGQQCYFSLPVPLVAQPQTEGVRHAVIGAVEPSIDRWLERQWSAPVERAEPPALDERLGERAPVIVAVERRHPVEAGTQRVLAVGCGNWMLSFVADVAVNVGGERYALVNPGHHELMLNSVAWLAGMDELVAAGPTGRQVSRLTGVNETARAGWGWMLLAILPGAWLAFGLAVWAVRRR